MGAAALVAAATTAVTSGPEALAAGTPRTALGADGQKLTVSASTGIDPAGGRLRVTGTGYDDGKGVYVAVCKDNGDNRVPTPCLGGADMTGAGGASRWIVPRGDSGAGAGAVPWGEGGTFDVELTVQAAGGGLDCLRVVCSVVTRVDHRGAGDRSQDVRIPLAFQGQEPDDGGDGVDVPPGTPSWVQAAESAFATGNAGRPLDLLLHPESGRLYVGADNIPDTSTVAEQGLYVLDPESGTALGHIARAPGAGGVSAARVVRRIVAPLPGDGVVFHYPLRGVGTARHGDTEARGIWADGASYTGVGQDADTSTVLVAAGGELRRVDIATGAVGRTAALEGAGDLAVDAVRGTAWSLGTSGGTPVLRKVGTADFGVSATVPLPADYMTFIETDPATGNVWVGNGTSVLVFDEDARPVAALGGTDRPMAVAFDPVTARAFLLREDLSDGSTDDTGSLEILDAATGAAAAGAVPLAGSVRVGTYAGVAVAPGATSVYVTRAAESKVLRFDLRTSPRIVRSPADLSAAAGEEVTLAAAAEAVPAPTVRWQVSTDGGRTWSGIEGADADVLTFTARAAQDGHRYRAEFGNEAGTTRTAPMTLTVTEPGDGGDGSDGGSGGDGGSGNGGSDSGGTGGAGGSGSSGGSGGDGTTGGSGGDGTGGAGGSGSSGGAAGGSGATVGGAGTAGTGGGSLASTGASAATVAGAALLLAAGGWYVRRRSRAPREV
ncbi:LPXTG cell wall anchor domain-containing protein [Streptomyces genisteinicus]|uniref:LPXTG cell wall anchor domain-containing protein n=1 Tax=Streptomyces genisteinicus TaxID=2768068 RepID=A0A7H0I495_9ACTN|nr:LPXTG cell wall anchor domain-containing protein [Streptomyces genisteinicus]